jgi:hypothetical protein
MGHSRGWWAKFMGDNDGANHMILLRGGGIRGHSPCAVLNRSRRPGRSRRFLPTLDAMPSLSDRVYFYNATIETHPAPHGTLQSIPEVDRGGIVAIDPFIDNVAAAIFGAQRPLDFSFCSATVSPSRNFLPQRSRPLLRTNAAK